MAVDFTAKQEALVQAHDCPYHRRLRETLRDFRQRQQKGEDEPSWAKWSEFTVRDGEGKEVSVLYNPQWMLKTAVHFEFFTQQGYRSHLLPVVNIPSQDIREYAAQVLTGPPEKPAVYLEPVKKSVKKIDYQHWRPLFTIMHQN